MERSFATVQELNKDRKELAAELQREIIASAGSRGAA